MSETTSARSTQGPSDDLRPNWVRDLDQSLVVRPHFVLWGNVRDVYEVPADEGWVTAPLLDVLWALLSSRGFEGLLVHDPVDGLVGHPPEATEVVGKIVGRDLSKGPVRVDLSGLQTCLRAATAPSEARHVAVVLDYASRMLVDIQHLSEPEQHFFTFCEKLIDTAAPVFAGEPPSALYNPVIWLLNREGDIPDWLLANEGMRSLAIPRPDLGARDRMARSMIEQYPGVEDHDEDAVEEAVRTFAARTEGLRLSSLIEVTQLAQDRTLSVTEIEDAVRAYKVGIPDNPWRHEHVRRRLAEGEDVVRRRVLGQDAAVSHAFDILKRSVMGLTGAHASSSATRPRGVLFFAGPTGVGKTELAKQLTELVFGDVQAYVRFDMSEFSAEQSGDRLIGAPPGYVGYEGGGELTNAVRQRPFSLVLFDEIEKAEPRILDKFLQILEDGRLTDGRGVTTHFTETIIVFTSNLGIYGTDEAGKRVPTVSAETDDYPAVRAKLLAAVERHFKERLNRPELLNRLGDNIVVFDFIRPDTAVQIFDILLNNVVERVRSEHKASLVLSDEARSTLLDLATSDLSNGGRGIGSTIESALVNPLARSLFAAPPVPGDDVTITAIIHTPPGGYEVVRA